MTFGERAAALAGAAAQLLGWKPDTFWGSTPAEFAASLGADRAIAEQFSSVELEQLKALFPDE